MTNLLNSYKPNKTGFFRFKPLNGKYLITNDVGDYAFLSSAEFKKFISGTLTKSAKVYKKLEAGKFFAEHLPAKPYKPKKLSEEIPQEVDSLPRRWLKKNSFLFSGPTLHIVVLTRHCNMACLYCHASAGLYSKNMKEATASRVLDTIMASPEQSFNIEFQGGEPLLNWPVLKYMVVEGDKRAKAAGKNITFSVVTNLTAMTDEKLNFLTEHSVNICTSLDGPHSLHDKNRPFAKGNSSTHACVTRWIKKITSRQPNGKYSADALLTVTRFSLPKWKQIVDEYIKIGAKGIFIRFLNPYGAARKTWGKIGYTAAEYIEFYKKALDYILELNHSGKSKIIEHTASIIAGKIFRDTDPNFLDLRSPCGAGIGQIAYDYDGAVYTCDEGRMLAAMGDTSFCMGDVKKNNYNQLINSPVTKCMVTASLTELQPACVSCVYKPYCGICPVFNYAQHGDLFMHGVNFRCEIYKGIFDYIFTLLLDKKNEKLLRQWGNMRGE